jgi:single-strand DNA-binding protein
MGSVNKVILVGNLGRDAELRFSKDGAAVASFSIATTDSYTDRSGTKQEKTEWHRISYWGKNAENVAPYLTRGKQVYVEGQLQTRKYEKDGQTHYATDIRAFKLVLLGSAGGGKREEELEEAPASKGQPQELNEDDIPF